MLIKIIKENIHRISLTMKMVILTLLAGFVVWTVLDIFVSKTATRLFRSRLEARLNRQVLEDRLRFDRYIKSHHQAARVFVSQKKTIDYIEKKKWSSADTVKVQYFTQYPEWFPDRSVFRALASPRYVLLLDRWGRTREVYHKQNELPSRHLLRPANLLLQKSRNQSFLTIIDGAPFLVASESIGSTGAQSAILMLASPIDDKFLIASQGSFHGRLVGLAAGDKTYILASSNIDLLPAGTMLDALQERYLISKKKFFDYGSSEILISFFSFIPTSDVNKLTSAFVSTHRSYRAVTAVTVVLSSVLVMFWITRRIEKLTVRVEKFSEGALKKQKGEIKSGDQLDILEDRFQRLMEDVIEYTAQLKKSINELESFSYSVSHDLRAPLRAIDGFSHILQDDYSKDLDSNGKRLLNVISDNAQKMGQLVDGLLSFTRLGRQKITFSSINMKKLASEMINEFKSISTGRTIEFKLEDLPDAQADRITMRQVFINLISNAIKYTKAGETSVIEIGHRIGHNESIYYVKDNGIGFDVKYADRIFGVFQRLHTEEEYEGTGLGLAIVKRVIHRHGGRVFAEGTIDKGATFYFTLPAKGGKR